MKVLLLTVAGTSSRFGKSLGRPCLKCLYRENNISESLLYKALHRDGSFDRFLIVGGYRFGELKETVGACFPDLADKIVLLENKEYATYGSGYSLRIGLRYALETGFDELVFAEGDLWVDKRSFRKLSFSKQDAVTYNGEPIFADKAVVFYFDTEGGVHYLYDTAHDRLEIGEPFVSVFNSGQMWKFRSFGRVRDVYGSMAEEEWHGTNLAFIQKYFGGKDAPAFACIGMRRWLNCNVVDDFHKIPRR